MPTTNVSFYRLMQKATRNVLSGDLNGNANTISMSPMNGQNNQQWQVEDVGDGYYKLSYMSSGKVLDGNGNQLYLLDWNGGDYQLWQKVDVGNGFYKFVQKATEKVLDGNGTQVYFNQANDGDYQCWSLAEMPIVYYEFVSLLNNQYLYGNGTTTYVAENISNSQDWWPQGRKWRLEDLGNGYFKVVHNETNTVLDGNGTSVYLGPWNGGDYQQWQWTAIGDGYGFKQKKTGNWLQLTTDGVSMGPSSSDNSAQWQAITTKHLLAPKQRPYSQVSFAMAHDSHTATHAYSDNDTVPENVDQTQPISDQLAGGIRTVRISSGTYPPGAPDNSAQTVILQHGDPYKLAGLVETFVECVFGTLEDYLTKVKEFLDTHPNEVITIIDEGDASGYEEATNVSAADANTLFTQLVANDYQSVFGSLLLTPAQQLVPDWYTLDQLQAGHWPTLEQMIAKGQRVIVFMSNLAGGSQFPWMLPAYRPNGLIAMNFYDAYNGDSIWRPAVQPDFFFSDRGPILNNSTPYMLNHQITQKLVGRTESSRAYSKWTVGDLLIENTIRAWQITGNKPTFLNVDFYQGVWGATSYLIDLVNTLNQVDSFDQVLTRWAGAPIYIQDTQGENNPQGFQIGRIYTIASAKSPSLSLSLSSDNTVQLQPTNSNDLHQQWQLTYNSPSSGIALMNRSQPGCYLCGQTREEQVKGIVYGDYHGQEFTGWQIGFNDGAWWIRRSLDQDTHLEVRGDDCNVGDPVQLYGWNNGTNQHFIFNPL